MDHPSRIEHSVTDLPLIVELLLLEAEEHLTAGQREEAGALFTHAELLAGMDR